MAATPGRSAVATVRPAIATQSQPWKAAAGAEECVPSGSRTGEQAARWWLPALVASVSAYLFFSLFSVGGVPHFRTGDEDFFWTYACRLLSGQVFVRDFHQFTPPGTDLVYAIAFRIFSPGVRSADWVIFGVGIAIAGLCYAAGRTLMRAQWAALAALVCLVIVYGARMDATHHWFSALADLAAVLILCRRRSWTRIAGAGSLVALAAFFTQTTGAVGLIACSAGLIWEWRVGVVPRPRLWLRLAALAGATFAVWTALSWRFIAEAGVANYWRAQVVDLPRVTRVPSGFLVPPIRPTRHALLAIAMADYVIVYILLITVCPWVLSMCLRGREETRRHTIPLILLSSLGVLEMLEFITALNWNRMAAAALPAAILAIWLIGTMRRRRRFTLVVCCCGLGAMMLVAPMETQLGKAAPVRMPTGTALVEAKDAAMVDWLTEHTRPGDCFFEVTNTRFYAPLGLRNPTPVDVLASGPWVPPEWVQEVIAGLESSRTQYILWDTHGELGKVEGGGPRRAGDRLDPLRHFMLDRYERIEVFANGEQVWARKGS